MALSRIDILKMIETERERQVDLPGSEFDASNTPNDWIAIASYYMSQESRRVNMMPRQAEFEKELIKAAAVIVAALEHSDHMKNKGELS